MSLFISRRDPPHVNSVGVCSIEYPSRFILLVLNAWVFKRVSVIAIMLIMIIIIMVIVTVTCESHQNGKKES